jgi:hypothetical protein
MKQLYIGRSVPTPEAIQPAGNDDLVKPSGGLWTSTYLGEAEGSAYVQFCLTNHYHDWLHKAWLLTPKSDALVYEINSVTDLKMLLEIYPLHPNRRDVVYLDWARIGQDFDAVHLTATGQEATRASNPGLYHWDCESTVWFKWCFEAVEPLNVTY